MALDDRHKDWFGRKKHKEEPVLRDSVDILKLKEASNLADKIEEFITPLVMAVAHTHGEVTFHMSIGLHHDIADKLTTAQIVDAIIESWGLNAEKTWADKPMRFMALVTVLRERL